MRNKHKTSRCKNIFPSPFFVQSCCSSQYHAARSLSSPRPNEYTFFYVRVKVCPGSTVLQRRQLFCALATLNERGESSVFAPSNSYGFFFNVIAWCSRYLSCLTFLWWSSESICTERIFCSHNVEKILFFVSSFMKVSACFVPSKNFRQRRRTKDGKIVTKIAFHIFILVLYRKAVYKLEYVCNQN